MAKVVITNASATKSFEYQACGKYENLVLAPNSSVEIPIEPIAWYSGAEKRAWYAALDGAMDGDITVAYDADTDVNSISFKVIAAIGGANISGATITYAEGLTLTTNASGVASVSGLEPGTYNITIAKTGYQNYTTSIVIGSGTVVAAQCQATMLLTAETNSMSFHIANAATAANIEGATITYGEGLTLTTAADGNASVASLAAGTYSITVSKTGFVSATTSVTFTAGHVGTFVAKLNLTAQ